MLYTFEIQLNWFPGCGWMRAPYARDTFEAALKEATAYASNAERNGMTCAVRVVRLESKDITPRDARIWGLA